MTPVPSPGRRHVDARFVLVMMGAMLSVADAFRASSSNPLRVSATPPKLPWPRPASTTRSTIVFCLSMTATTTAATAVSAEVAFAPIISELKARIADAPNPLEDNESAQRHADQLGKAFEVGGDGNLVGGFAEEVRLAGALSMDTFVVRYTAAAGGVFVCAPQRCQAHPRERKVGDAEKEKERKGSRRDLFYLELHAVSVGGCYIQQREVSKIKKSWEQPFTLVHLRRLHCTNTRIWSGSNPHCTTIMRVLQDFLVLVV